MAQVATLTTLIMLGGLPAMARAHVNETLIVDSLAFPSGRLEFRVAVSGLDTNQVIFRDRNGDARFILTRMRLERMANVAQGSDLLHDGGKYVALVGAEWLDTTIQGWCGFLSIYRVDTTLHEVVKLRSELSRFDMLGPEITVEPGLADEWCSRFKKFKVANLTHRWVYVASRGQFFDSGPLPGECDRWFQRGGGDTLGKPALTEQQLALARPLQRQITLSREYQSRWLGQLWSALRCKAGKYAWQDFARTYPRVFDGDVKDDGPPIEFDAFVREVYTQLSADERKQAPPWVVSIALAKGPLPTLAAPPKPLPAKRKAASKGASPVAK